MLLKGIPHRQILHPMLFYRIFGFSDFPKIQKIGISDNPDSRVFRNFRNPIFRKSGESEYLKIRISGFSGISEFRCPKIRIFGNPKIRIFRFPDFQISENQDFRKSENPDFPISGASDVEFSRASHARHRMGPDPSKKDWKLHLREHETPGRHDASAGKHSAGIVITLFVKEVPHRQLLQPMPFYLM